MDSDAVGTIKARGRASRSLALSFLLSPPLIRVLSLVLFFLIWGVASLLVESRALPSPLGVAENLVEYTRDGDLIETIAITLARVAVSFFIAIVIGTTLGILMGRYRGVD